MVLYSVLFLILAALAPPLILLGIIYRLDQIEREPPGLLWSLFLRGVLAMVPILVLEMLADQFIDFFYWRPMVYLFLAYFVVPGFIEEGIKYRVLRRRLGHPGAGLPIPGHPPPVGQDAQRGEGPGR